MATPNQPSTPGWTVAWPLCPQSQSMLKSRQVPSTVLQQELTSVPPTRPSSRAEREAPADSEEDQIRRATAISLGQNANQKSGVTLAPNYDDDKQWALTAPDVHVQEIVLPPEPSARRRQNEPALLRPLKAAGFMPALLTILHSIPLAREAFVNRSALMDDYGRDPNWWNGTGIQRPRIVEGDALQADLRCLTAELQRLMAFLDNTDRAYGSVEVLSSLCDAVYCQAGQLGQFLSIWQKAAPSSLDRIFDFRGVQRQTSGFQREEIVRTMQLSIGPSSTNQTLIDALDFAVWTDDDGDDETFFASLGDIFIIEVENMHSSGLGIEVPIDLCLDRYTEQRVPDVQALKQRKQAAREQANWLEKLRVLLTMVPGSPLGADELLKSITSFLEHEPVAKPRIRTTLDDLAQLRAAVVSQLDRIEAEKAAIPAHVQDIQLTEPCSNKYVLRGFRTQPHILYLGPHDDDQWRRMVYSRDSPTPVSSSFVAQGEALRASSQESQQVLLVYANEHALSFPTTPLPAALEAFVQTDNAFLTAEIEAQQSTVSPESSAGNPQASPVKFDAQ